MARYILEDDRDGYATFFNSKEEVIKHLEWAFAHEIRYGCDDFQDVLNFIQEECRIFEIENAEPMKIENFIDPKETFEKISLSVKDEKEQIKKRRFEELAEQAKELGYVLVQKTTFRVLS